MERPTVENLTPAGLATALALVAGAAALAAAADVVGAALVPAPLAPGPWLAVPAVAALLLRRGARLRLAVAIAAVAALLAADAARGVPRAAALAEALAASLEVAVAVAVLRRGRRRAGPGRVPVAVLRLGALAVLAPAMGAAAASLAGAHGGAWFVAHASALAALLALPLARRSAGAGGRAEAALLAAALLGVGWCAFASAHSTPHGHATLLAPLLLWAAARFGPGGTLVASAAVAAMALGGTARGLGELALGRTPEQAVREAFLSVCVLAAPALVLAAALERLGAARGAVERSAARAGALVEELRLFLRHAPLPVYVKDARSRFLAVSDAIAGVVGRSPAAIVGRPIEEVWPPEIAAQLRAEDARALADGAYRGSFEHAGRSYMTIKFRIGEGPRARIGGFLVDLTERGRTERALRLATVGTLASGIAHEVNNPLAVVISSAEYLAAELDDPAFASDPARVDELRAAARDALACAGRVATIVAELRRLTSVEEEPHAPFEPRRAVERALAFVEARIRKRGTLTLELGPAPAVLGSERELAQALVNVLAAAADALPPRGGTVRLALGTDDAGRARVEVTDDGPPIPQPALGRVFDPFFTARPPGPGGGVGLAIAHAIVQRLGGELDLASGPGGTVVRVALPPAARDRAAAPAASRPAPAGDVRPLPIPPPATRAPARPIAARALP